MLGRVDAEPLNSAPGAEEGSLMPAQGPDEEHVALVRLNRA
jgi:hypothetical protein